MSKEDWVNNPVHKILQQKGLWPFLNVSNVLDVACGLSLKSRYLGADNILGVDIHKPYLKAIDYNGAYSTVVYDVRKLPDIFMENSFDVVYALDIIEHLEKDESIRLLEDCKKIARKAVVIETPKGFIPQNIDIQGFDADHLQTHRCGWEVEELKALGFKCVVRPYQMQDIKRHTDKEVDTSIELIDAIYIKE